MPSAAIPPLLLHAGGCRALAEALHTNNTLQTLKLGHNLMSEVCVVPNIAVSHSLLVYNTQGNLCRDIA